MKKIDYIILAIIIFIILLPYFGFLTFFQWQQLEISMPSEFNEDDITFTVSNDAFKCSYNYNVTKSIQPNEITISIVVSNFKVEGSNHEGQIEINLNIGCPDLEPPENGILEVMPSGMTVETDYEHLYVKDTTWKIGDTKMYFPGPREWVIIGDRVEIDCDLRLRLSVYDNAEISISVKPSTWIVNYVAEINLKVTVNEATYKGVNAYTSRWVTDVNGNQFIEKTSKQVSDTEFIVPIYYGENNLTVQWYEFSDTENIKGSAFRGVPANLQKNINVPNLKIVLAGNGALKDDVSINIYYQGNRRVKVFNVEGGTVLPKTYIYPAPSPTTRVTVNNGDELLEETKSFDRSESEVMFNFDIPDGWLTTPPSPPPPSEKVSFKVVVKTTDDKRVKGVDIYVKRESDLQIIAHNVTDDNGEVTFTVDADEKYFIYAKVNGITCWITPHGAEKIEDGTIYTLTLSNTNIDFEPPDDNGGNNNNTVIPSPNPPNDVQPPPDGLTWNPVYDVTRIIEKYGIATYMFYGFIAVALIIIIIMLRKEVDKYA